MIGKVKIPQNVADAYTVLEAVWTLTEIFKMVTADFTVSDSRVQTLVEWNESGRYDEGAGLMKLLLGQYEVEEEYKVGDWVIYKGFEGDVTVKIVAIQYEHARVQFESVSNWQAILDIERHATPEEIRIEKERRAWAKIGRGVGEFRENDVIRDLEGEVFDLTFGETVIADGLLSLRDAKVWYEKGEIKSFCPYESFISFEDGDSNA